MTSSSASLSSGRPAIGAPSSYGVSEADATTIRRRSSRPRPLEPSGRRMLDSRPGPRRGSADGTGARRGRSRADPADLDGATGGGVIARSDRSGTARRDARGRMHRRGSPPPMSVAASSPATLGATALLGRGLTPGKLRGLQRISNPNGTLTMVAFDQNSSMIDLAKKGLKAKGEDRDPTYDEIVEAKLDMVRQMAPKASGILIDAYYAVWPAIATGAMPPEKRPDRPDREVRRPEEQGRRPARRDRARPLGREAQADGRRRRQAARPVRADASWTAASTSSTSSMKIYEDCRSSTSSCCSSRSPSR